LSISEFIGIALFVLGGVVVLVWRISARNSEIWFKTLDEVSVMKELMYWAAPKVPAPMSLRLQVRSFMISANGIASLQSITREELAILAPYIDEWIAGKLPPQNLPAEYEDWRPRVLLALKQRLQSEGRWPLAISRKQFADREKQA
jgi:hypothetical protein